MGGARSMYGKNALKFGGGNLKEKQIGRPGRRKVCNIEIGLKEFGWECVDVAQDRRKWTAVADKAMKLWVT